MPGAPTWEEWVAMYPAQMPHHDTRLTSLVTDACLGTKVYDHLPGGHSVPGPVMWVALWAALRRKDIPPPAPLLWALERLAEAARLAEAEERARREAE